MSFPSSASQSSSSQGQTIALSDFLAQNDDLNFLWDDDNREESASWLGPVEAARLDRTKHKVFKHRSKEYLRPPSPFVQQGLELGESGSTVVYRATPPEGYPYRRPLAVKIIVCKEYARPPGPDSKARMDALKEVKTMSMLRHPHIVVYVASFEEYCLQNREISRKIKSKSKTHGKDQNQVAGFGKADQRIKKHILGIAMYPPAQCNLHGFMDEIFQKPNSAEWIIQQMHNFFGCLSQAVAYLHRQGIQIRHKDIKPDNIVIDDFGVPVLTDFGLSKHFEFGQHSEGPTPKTLKYADPEAVHESRRDERSDVFSLGCVFLEMATVLLGRPAMFAEEQLAASSADDHQSLSSRSSDFMYSESLHNLDAYLTTLTIIAQDLVAQKTVTRDPQAVLAILPHIRRMMDESVARRPQAYQLYPWFRHLSDVYVFPGPCKNCERERRTGKAIPSRSGSRSRSGSTSASANGSPTLNRVGTSNGGGVGASSSQRLARRPTMARIASSPTFPHSQP
ncbi:hypothetical protein VTJ49DRAFT_3711 [Mycothermus thermophilus]|uniref:non-specific serine/threonine protein kinase n=1 Tax=Humicola insolens TaxID=85995 RepID=A0ABR3VMK1_HUMIN